MLMSIFLKKISFIVFFFWLNKRYILEHNIMFNMFSLRWTASWRPVCYVTHRTLGRCTIYSKIWCTMFFVAIQHHYSVLNNCKPYLYWQKVKHCINHTIYSLFREVKTDFYFFIATFFFVSWEIRWPRYKIPETFMRIYQWIRILRTRFHSIEFKEDTVFF